MINIIFKKTNLLTASLFVISVVSCGEPYEYTPSNNSKYPVWYPAIHNYTDELKKSSECIDELSNKNIKILDNLINALKPYQRINKVSTEKNAKFITDTSLELNKIKTYVTNINTNNKTLYNKIPTAITPASLDNSDLYIIQVSHSAIEIKKIGNIKSGLLSIFNDNDVIRFIGQKDINDIKEKINKLESFFDNHKNLEYCIILFSNYTKNAL